ncbi:carboxymuconolactone decarboxylase family protein [Photobacterium atrarenae]|uniref:Carboxymuconolactone decarboxylase family protein n=1 Tax=Photobacterium atrarenae TaxID=865757 RepID=A0ABY5GNH6_9GAMM|nr:carboxymuconolactone decarboxylase family protein [Photobacterium atrarenae]UTV30644.1 carboxymuconolactone decarboxylase family protein [Photobacterium atrarenae]
MDKRISISQLEPDAYKSMFGLEKYLNNTNLEKSLKELIKIRASQINGCAYCIQIHTEEAMKHGETEQRIFALSAWKESPLFNDQERAVLQLTEKVTLIAEGGLPKECYDAALSTLGEQVLAQAIMQIVTINAWNRIAVATHMVHE